MAGKPVANGASRRKEVTPHLRPRCARCNGWLYVEIVLTPDRCLEVACINCGGRRYVRQRRPRQDETEGQAEKRMAE